MLRQIGEELRPVSHAHIIRRREMNRAADVKARVRPEHDAVRVHQEEIGIGHRGARIEGAIDIGEIVPRNPVNNVRNGARAGKCRRLAGIDVEVAEAVKEIISANLLGGVLHVNRVMRPGQRSRRLPQASITDDLTGGLRYPEDAESREERPTDGRPAHICKERVKSGNHRLPADEVGM